jgi:hypothetical protein
MGTAFVSYLLLSLDTKSRVNRRASSMEWHTGPAESLMETCPVIEPSHKFLGTRIAVGLIPYRPLKAAGARIDPPTSVDGAIGQPFMATKAPSPPELPPAPRFRLYGLRVRPQRLLTVSKTIPVWGMAVLQKKTAPASRMIRTTSESWPDTSGTAFRMMYPRVVTRPFTL